MTYAEYLERSKQYFDIYQNTLKMDFSDFYIDIAEPVVFNFLEEDKNPKWFEQNLYWRFIDLRRSRRKGDFLEELHENIKPKDQKDSDEDFIDEIDDSINEKELNARKELLPKSNKEFWRKITLLEELEKDVLGNKIKGKTCINKLIRVAKIEGITFFIGHEIEKIPCLLEVSEKSRQNNDYHVKKFDKFITTSSFLDKDGFDGANENAKTLQKLGERIKSKARILQAIFFDSDLVNLLKEEGIKNLEGKEELISEYKKISKSKILFLAFLSYLRASFFFKEALIYDAKLAVARYSYAFCIKRLGKLDDALLELKDCLKLLKSKKMIVQRTIVLESIGDVYLLKRKYNEALQYFLKFEELVPEDIECLLNLLEVYMKLDDEEKILSTLKKIDNMDEDIKTNRRQLILDLLNKSNGEIIKICITILNKKSKIL